MKRFLALLLAACLAACSAPEPAAPESSSPAPASAPSEAAPAPEAPEVPEPAPAQAGWQTGAPEDHGFDPAVLEALHAALPGSGIHGVAVVKDGVLIDEWYGEGYDEESLFPLHSASKSYTGALIGIAIGEGCIGGVDDPISLYLPQVLEEADSRKQGITIRHLLTHTSGLAWYEWGSGYSNWTEFRSAENWVDYILGRELLYEPGTVFNYSTGNTHLLSAILEAATGMSQEEDCREKLFDPLGVSEATHWGTDPQGIADGGNGLLSTVRDAALFGQLFLQEGNWNGEQLVPADWAAESTSAQNGGAGDGTGSYGFQWWVRPFTTGENGSYATPYPTASYDTYYAFGHAGQFILVVPELRLVTVFVSSCRSSYGPRPYFTDYILNAYTG